MNRVLLSLLLAGCVAEEDDAACPEGMPDQAEALPGVLGNADTCTHWSLAIDEHAYIDLQLDESDLGCEYEPSGAIDMPYEPIYSNFEPDGPKWTFDVVGGESGSGELWVECEEGTTWQGWFTVQ